MNDEKKETFKAAIAEGHMQGVKIQSRRWENNDLFSIFTLSVQRRLYVLPIILCAIYIYCFYHLSLIIATIFISATARQMATKQIYNVRDVCHVDYHY